LLGAPGEERDAASASVEAALAHPLLIRARTAARCHREYPIVLALADGKLLEGVIDLAFVDDAAWVVVDFKTDADSPGRRQQYERQLQWYCYALARSTGIPARAWLLGV
jgi:ATP-dependent helicase/nuclease subunit A